MAMGPVVSAMSASACTVISVFGVVILTVMGYGFSNNWPALMGSVHDPKNGAAVGSTCYAAAVIYAAMIAFCGCQLGLHKRKSRGGDIAL
ncbi:hypothetical protein BDV93DRAFT_523292 [Ceratobasidium sp. AG-I]|nr:hypothetical protein BDV93DRAFT_523292 [Ceratobasidium sp. AG-I]